MKTITDLIARYDMFPKRSRVLCAVSGGADSMALLHWMKQNEEKLQLTVLAAHFEHGIRGEESMRDQCFVERFCRDRHIPLITGCGKVPAYASENGLGLEEAARNLRYAFLERTAAEERCDRIATAHNADDNTETVLLNLIRGAGAAGLCGIPPVRGIIVRPLLSTTREEIECYLEENGVPHVEDSSNESDACSRNLLRHHVMPVLKEINPAVERAVLRSGELLRDDAEYLEDLAETFISGFFDGNSVPAKKLAALPGAVQSRVIRRLCPERLGTVHTRDIMKLATGTELAYLDVPGARIRRQKGRIYFTDPPVPKNKTRRAEETGDENGKRHSEHSDLRGGTENQSTGGRGPDHS
ncbi:MAG: tRNA lysidine(34) synthetase TilS [Oscillospiraceae bacterium]|nr:tRNA lysidine(34) synthetase TilS [Oscillospiraceae bacterium]